MEIKVVDFQSATAPADFEKTIKETGFGVLSNHPISPTLIDGVYRDWEAFFNSDERFDPAYEFKNSDHSGYVPFDLSETAKGNDIKDLKEFFHYYYPWGRIPDNLREKTEALCQQLTDLASTLLEWIEANMPTDLRDKLSEHLSDMLKGSNKNLFRLLHYPALQGDEPVKAVRAAAHEDIDFLTLLPAATAKGLEAQDTNGNWIPVPCDHGWIIVNVGDMLQECTAHHYPSTTHRVVNPNGEAARKARMSMPLFLHPRNEVILSDKYTAQSYREERYRELGLLAEGESIEL
ncbi:MAG: 2OG-Fe(II) oxygenase [Coxiella sp. (in: Bacteria)]|nr:MAG: 2OG-Fe(II) oxygenase [Coxiella sp. (in: g-proteobacteria)]